MKEELLTLKEEFAKELEECNKEAEVLNTKAKYLGKKSRFSEIMSNLKNMSVSEKKEFGSLINNTKKEMEEKINNKIISLESKSNILFDDTVVYETPIGSLHPVTIVAKEVTDILKRMGFTVVSGPEMETEYYNFEALNVP